MKIGAEFQATAFERIKGMVIEFLDESFIPIFLIIGFSMKLWASRGTDRTLRYYWLTVISTLILIVADALENWAQGDPNLRFWRIFFSVVGYVMRPGAALSIAMIVYPATHRPRFLWIPFVLNLGVYATAFFSPIAFSYGDDYSFTRGPLGYTVFVISFFYIIFAVWMTWRRFREKDHTRERFILYLCAVACIAAAILDMETEGAHLNSAIMISSVFLYMFRRSIDTNRDVLTLLLNRMSFFEDCSRFNASISAVGAADMNGLKTLNDVVGHEAGDIALKEIGKCLDEVSNRNILAYRTGGDEFALLFIRQPENTVHDTMEKFKGLVKARGYTVSTGYAMRGGKYASVQDLIRWADENMYANKAAYYTEINHDRRRTGIGQTVERRG